MKSKSVKSKHHDFVADLVWQIKVAKLPMPEREYKFHPKRKWKMDLAWVDRKISMEIDGGIWLPKGGHTSGGGFIKNAEKRNEAQLMGWHTYHVVPSQVKSGEALKLIEKIFK